MGARGKKALCLSFLFFLIVKRGVGEERRQLLLQERLLFVFILPFAGFHFCGSFKR